MFKLLRYFSIVSLITVVIAAVLLAVSYRQVALRDILELGENRNVGLTQSFAKSG